MDFITSYGPVFICIPLFQAEEQYAKRGKEKKKFKLVRNLMRGKKEREREMQGKCPRGTGKIFIYIVFWDANFQTKAVTERSKIHLEPILYFVGNFRPIQ